MTAENDRGSHWEQVYATRTSDELSWYQSTPTTSLRLLATFGSPRGSVIDVGGGSSPLAGALLDANWTDVTVLDISYAALAASRQHLGDRADQITYVTADLLSWAPQRSYDAWHDRAVFHFLVELADRQAYLRLAERAIAPGGVLILGTFAPDGPKECSGLPTARYTSDQLARAFAPSFTLEHAEREQHQTPTGTIQPFTWVVMREQPE
jgi:ubiquinone/menaquinone biosynthesis C-methylase UbiE